MKMSRPSPGVCRTGSFVHYAFWSGMVEKHKNETRSIRIILSYIKKKSLCTTTIFSNRTQFFPLCHTVE